MERSKGQQNGASLVKDAIYGAIGGIVGTLVMEQVANGLYKFEADEKKKIEEQIRPEPPFMTLARRLAANGADGPPSEKNVQRLGQAIHWGYGIGWGALYGALHDRVPALSRAAGLPFGIVFSLIGDELMTTAMKLTPPPQAFPIDAHVRGLVAHVAYTAAADGVYHTLKRVGG